jgi:hypothetical protein
MSSKVIRCSENLPIHYLVVPHRTLCLPRVNTPTAHGTDVPRDEYSTSSPTPNEPLNLRAGTLRNTFVARRPRETARPPQLRLLLRCQKVQNLETTASSPPRWSAWRLHPLTLQRLQLAHGQPHQRNSGNRKTPGSRVLTLTSMDLLEGYRVTWHIMPD